MKIVDVRITGLSGGTVEGGWVDDLKPEEDINTIMEVLSDEGLVGIGSAMTSKALVEASIKLMRPLLIGERADEPARVSEKLRQSLFWQGRGGDVELMVDAGGSEQFWPHGYKWALETAKMLAGYDVVWFEEALPPDDLEGFIELRRHAPLPITTGEVLTRRQSFRPYLERHAVDIIQPDCTKCGGLTEAWRIGWMAYEHNILLVPHGWNTAIGLAADLHLTASLPVARYVEYLTPSPYLDALITQPFRPAADGYLHVPPAPGLGIELNRGALKRSGLGAG